MKIIFTSLSLLLLVTFSACNREGPIGPRGPQGPTGPQGAPGESGFVFEYESINFTAPDYEVILPYPDDFEGYDSDVALVYLLWDVQNIGGEDVEIWRPLPQTVITAEGLLQYNFDFSKYDVRLFLDASFPLDNLTAIDTDDWIARIVIVPGDFWDTNGRMDVSDYSKVKEALGLPDFAPHRDVAKRRSAN